jgi:hypothetical protein
MIGKLGRPCLLMGVSRLRRRRDDKGKACRAPQLSQKSLLLPVEFAAVHAPASPHQRPNAFILIHVAERIFAARGLQHNISKPAQRRDDIGADVAIVARNFAETLRPTGKATHQPRNRVAPTLTMQELLAARAGRLMSV